jgi:hypothetical protein
MFESEIAQYARCMKAFCSFVKLVEVRVVSLIYSGAVLPPVKWIDLVLF